MPEQKLLVMIPHEAGVGYAVGRLAHLFRDVALDVTGSLENVYFSYSRIGDGRDQAPALLPSNLIAFDFQNYSKHELGVFTNWLAREGITDIFAFDLAVEAGWTASARRSGVKRIVSYWGAPISKMRRGAALLFRQAEVGLRRHAPDHYVFESEAMRRTATHGRGIPAGQTSVVYNGVEVGCFRRRPEAAGEVYRIFGIPERRRIIVFMGHAHRRKGIHVLIAAMERLVCAGRTDLHLLILGNRGQEEAELSRLAGQALGHVTFGGYRTDVPVLLSGCYAGCIPTTGWDSFPLSPLELQSCGLPVIVSDCQGLPEAVIAGKTGFIVPAGNVEALSEQIAVLADQPDLRDEMGEQAAAWIRSRFPVDRQRQELSRLLRT